MAATLAFALIPDFMKSKNAAQQTIALDADTLFRNYEAYLWRSVSIEGDVVHICPVNGKKLKLKTPQGHFIKVVADGVGIERFDETLGKHIRITGMVFEERVSRMHIAKSVENTTILCQIDHTPCVNSQWVALLFENDQAIQYVESTAGRLNDIIDTSVKGYIAIVGIAAFEVLHVFSEIQKPFVPDIQRPYEAPSALADSGNTVQTVIDNSIN
jgi:hypothetical protein